ncbi:hypothetical protein HOG98_01375 [bacterium]|jgi:hypothetical protein|nr:hypothetical protein [bacterium]
MNNLKINGLILALLLLIGGSSIWAHSDAPHDQPPKLVKVDIRETLKNKTIPEMWIYIDETIKDLALAMKKNNGSKKSKKELVRLKKALDILKETQISHHKKMNKPHDEHKGHH